MEGMLRGRCRKAVSQLRNEPSVPIPPAQQHFPFPCHMQQLQGWVLRSTAWALLASNSSADPHRRPGGLEVERGST